MQSATQKLSISRQPTEPQLAIFQCVPNDKSYIIGFVAMVIGALFLLWSIPCIITISPTSFTFRFTLSMISFLTSLAFFNGPRTYLNKLFNPANRIKASLLFASIILSLWVSLMTESLILVLLFCFIQVIFSLSPFSWVLWCISSSIPSQ